MKTFLTWLFESFAGSILDAISDYFKEQENNRTKEELGAVKQREQDLRAENERIAKAAAARDTVANSGGVRIEDDPWNRANRKQQSSTGLHSVEGKELLF